MIIGICSRSPLGPLAIGIPMGKGDVSAQDCPFKGIGPLAGKAGVRWVNVTRHQFDSKIFHENKQRQQTTKPNFSRSKQKKSEQGYSFFNVACLN